MNDFTKSELKTLHEFLDGACEDYHEPNSTYELRDKIQSMIDNYWMYDVQCIAKSHLKQASSLISHAMCLLNMDDDNLLPKNLIADED